MVPLRCSHSGRRSSVLRSVPSSASRSHSWCCELGMPNRLHAFRGWRKPSDTSSPHSDHSRSACCTRHPTRASHRRYGSSPWRSRPRRSGRWPDAMRSSTEKLRSHRTEGAREAPYPFGDSFLVELGESQYEFACTSAAHIERLGAGERDPFARRAPHELVVRNAQRKPREQMHPCALASNNHAITEGALQLGDERVPAPLIESAHPTQVTLEVPFADEIGEGVLLDEGRLAVAIRFGADEDVGETPRNDDVTDPQCREEDLRKRSDVDDAARFVEPLQRRNRALGVPKGAIVIVLEDDRTATMSPAQQLDPST